MSLLVESSIPSQRIFLPAGRLNDALLEVDESVSLPSVFFADRRVTLTHGSISLSPCSSAFVELFPDSVPVASNAGEGIVPLVDGPTGMDDGF